MMPHPCQLNCILDKRADIDFGPVQDGVLLRDPCGTQHLFHGTHQPLGVGEHDLVELATLSVIELPLLQGLKVQANRGDGSFQFVGNSVEEAVLLFVAAHLSNQEDGVQDYAGNDETEKQHAQDKRHDLAPVEDDPTDIEHQRHRSDKHAEGDGKRDRLLSAGDAHGAFTGSIAPQKRRTAQFAPSVLFTPGMFFARRGNGQSTGLIFLSSPAARWQNIQPRLREDQSPL
jgi:hypothetical protein